MTNKCLSNVSLLLKKTQLLTFNARGQCRFLSSTNIVRCPGVRRHIRSLSRSGIPIMADSASVEALLQHVEKADGGVDSLDVASSIGVDHQVIVGAVKSLQSLGDVSFPR